MDLRQALSLWTLWFLFNNGWILTFLGFPGGTSGQEHACQDRRQKRHRFDPWVREIPLKKEMATNSSILTWEIPWTEGPGWLQTTVSQRIGHS